MAGDNEQHTTITFRRSRNASASVTKPFTRCSSRKRYRTFGKATASLFPALRTGIGKQRIGQPGRSRLWRTRLERVRSPRELRRRQNTPNKPAHRRRGGQGGAAGTLGVARLLWLVRCGGGGGFLKDKIFTQSLTQFHISRI